MKKNMKILAGVFLTVGLIFTPFFTENVNETEWISKWNKENLSISPTTWELDETYDTYNPKEFILPNTSGFKSYMPHNLFLKKSRQYVLQQYAYTDDDGLRRLAGKYMIAVGTHYFEDKDNMVGTYIDLVLENGTVIECLVGDIKDDKDTDSDNIVTLDNGCVSEFICEKKKMDEKIRRIGDVSYLREEWDSPVVKIIIYERNIFNE